MNLTAKLRSPLGNTKLFETSHFDKALGILGAYINQFLILKI